MTKILTAVLSLLVFTCRAQDGVLNFIFTSDIHYGITRHHFRGSDSVQSNRVNEAMIIAMDQVPQAVLPADSGIEAGKPVQHIEALLITGDIANREEKGVQSAEISWDQFRNDYGQLHITTINGQPSPLWLCAGNHDVSNAIGYSRPLQPLKDASSMVGMYNMMLHPAKAMTKEAYDHNTERLHYSKDIGGVHFLFVDLWPDLAEQQWIEQDLQKLRPNVPVLLFTHAPPDVDARFFTNPNGAHTLNDTDKFENLLPELFMDGTSDAIPALAEQKQLASFLKKHPAIKAWFHGHENFSEFYDWKGPDHDISLPCFRVDSPMKGRISSKDETKLSFQLISLDTVHMTLTVRECCWNTTASPSATIQWGAHRSIPLR